MSLGNDIEDICRFEALITKPTFFNKVYTDYEREYICTKSKQAQTAAGIYCAKEAVAKALGRGFSGIRPNEIEIRHDEHGAPYACILGEKSEKYQHALLSISISHCDLYAVATCIAQAE